MQMRNFRLISMLAAIALICTNAHADVITFDALNLNPLVGSQTEGAFTYQVISGVNWRIDNTNGNPGSALSTGFPGLPGTGDRVDFFLTGGGLFTFDSVDFASAFNSPASDTVHFFGEVGGMITQQLLAVVSNSTTFQTAVSGFSAPIDRLRVQVNAVGISPLQLDNFVFTPVAAVPEPSSIAMFGVGAVGLVFARRKRRQTKLTA